MWSKGIQPQVFLQPSKPIPEGFERSEIVIVVIPNQLLGASSNLVYGRACSNIVIGVESRALHEHRGASAWQIALGICLPQHVQRLCKLFGRHVPPHLLPI
jgi:hypothetical protein